jgi:hypothetical protein
MNTTTRNLVLRILGAAVILASFIGPLKAADNVDIDIHVSIYATKEVTASDTFYYFGAIPIDTSSNSATAIVITNNSTALIETYTIQGGDAISDTAGTDWTLAASTDSTGPNTYALAAQFSSARPDNQEASWMSDHLNRLTPVTCTTTVLGDGSAGDEGASVDPSDTRDLYFRILTPTSTADGGAHTATINLSVL